MMLLDIQQAYAHITFGLSIFTNLLLLSFLLFRGNKNLGGYKYLMFSFSFLGIFFSVVDFLNKPVSWNVSEVKRKEHSRWCTSTGELIWFSV